MITKNHTTSRLTTSNTWANISIVIVWISSLVTWDITSFAWTPGAFAHTKTGNEAWSQYFNFSTRIMVQTISVAQFYLSFIYANVTLSHYGLHIHPPSEKYLAFKTSSVSLDITFCFLVDVPSSFHFSSRERDWKKHLS